jgi:hypothetical protein
MPTLFDLWLPILLSAVGVLMASSILHMCLPIHKGDYRKLPGESELLAAMRGQSVEPGHYAFPRPESMAEMADPEMIEKFKQGPVGYATIMPNGVPSIVRSLVHWFAYLLVVGILVAYVCTITFPTGEYFMPVFRVVSTASFLAYGASHAHESIWKGLSWRISGKFMFDGVIYSLITAAIFGWLWPDA